MNPPKLKGLGRGLDALLAANNTPDSSRQAMLPVGALQPGKYQPRTRMDPGSLDVKERLEIWRRMLCDVQPHNIPIVLQVAGDELAPAGQARFSSTSRWM